MKRSPRPAAVQLNQAIDAVLPSFPAGSPSDGDVLSRVLEASLDGCLCIDRVGRLLNVNGAYCHQSGYGREELLGRSVSDLEAVNCPESIIDHIADALEGHMVFLSVHRGQSGLLRNVEVSLTSCDASGSRYLAFFRDVSEPRLTDTEHRIHRWHLQTELARREEALKASNAFNSSVLNSVAAEIAVVNLQGTIVSANEAWQRASLHGAVGAARAASNPAVGSNYFDSCAKDGRFSEVDAVKVCNGMRAVSKGRLRRFEFDYLARSFSRPRWFTFTVAPLLNEGRGRVVVTHTDVSKLKEAERQSAKLFQAVEQSPVSIFITDTEGSIEYVNSCFTRVTGYTLQDVAGKTPRVLNSGHTSVETYAELWQALRRREAWQGMLQNCCKDGRLIWVATSISPIVGADGQVTHYVAVMQDLSDRKRLEEKLESHQAHLEDLVAARTTALSEALDAAHLADRVKDEFLANITHELRTPLAAVIGFSGLARPLSSHPQQIEYLDKLASAGRMLKAIIDDLLDLSKISAGHMELLQSHFSVRQLLARCRDVIGYKAQEKGLALLEHVGQNVPDCLFGDSLRIEQILLNLLSNAVKFTDSGQIELRVFTASRDGNKISLCIDVKDTGIGLSATEITALFTPFSQADASITRRFGGTGLGLTICKKLAGMMGGDIAVSSVQNRGSVFHVTLCLEDGDPSLVVVPEPDLDTMMAKRYSGARVMVVDDQALNRDVVKGLLGAVGILPAMASNGQEALDLLAAAANGFDLIFMDIQMPVMDGLSATRHIRANSGGLMPPPVVAMTAHSMAHERQRAIEAGMCDQLSKPFDETEFYRVLAKWIPSEKQNVVSGNRPQSIHEFQDIPGIDTAAGLALLQGDAVRYRYWLGEFVSDAPRLTATIRSGHESGHLQSASMAAHALKGKAGMLGMRHLHELAAALDSALPKGSPVAELLLSIECIVVDLCHEIRIGLEMSGVAHQTDTHRAAPYSEDLPASVLRLVERLRVGDGDCERIADACLAELGSSTWGNCVRLMLIYIRNYDYDGALRLIPSEDAALPRAT